MAVKEVRIIVAGVSQPVIFDGTLQAFVTQVPKQDDDLYDVLIEVEDFAGGITIQSSFFSLPEGEIPRFVVKNRSGQALNGVKITAFHRNPTGGTNFGRADFRETDGDGIAFLYLTQGEYNVEIEVAKFKKQILLNFQVPGGIVLFDNAGGTVPDTRLVQDPSGTPVQDASVKVVNTAALPQAALVVHQKTDVDGKWTAALAPNTPYSITIEKAGKDLVRAEVQNA